MRSTSRAALPLSLLLACGGDSDGGSLSRDEAAARVIDQLVTAGDPVVVLGMADPLVAGDRIVEYHPLAAMRPEVAIEAEHESWFFWIDDEPGARFDHASRFAMVDRTSGEVTTLDVRWWPLHDNASLWDDAAYDSREDWIYFELPDGESSRAAFVPETLPFTDCSAGGGHAVVINGVEADERGVADFNKDGANMHDALTDAGLDTTYFGPAGAEAVDEQPTDANLDAYFGAKAAELGPGDTFVVYLGGHGFNWEEGEYANGDTHVGGVWESDLERWLAKFDPGVNVVVMIDGCHSGGMLDALTCVADLAVSATDRDKASWGDLDGEDDTNPQDNGGEWTSSMLTCWSTLMEADESRSGVADRAKASGRNFFTELVSECWEQAPMYDLAHQRGKSAPQRSLGTPKTALPQQQPQPPVCDAGEPMPESACGALELEILPELLDRLVGLDETAACDGTAAALEQGNVCLHSDGQKTATADAEVDAVLHYSASGLSFELPACGDTVFCSDAPAEPEGTRYTVMALRYDADLVTAGTKYYQYGFVFDSDGDTTNNYEAEDPWPADFYDGTDLWLQLTGGGGAPWHLELVDAADGFSLVPRFTAAIVEHDTLVVVMPDDLLRDASGMRFTSFRHEGDYGTSMPWSGDVVPPVGDPLLPLPR